MILIQYNVDMGIHILLIILCLQLASAVDSVNHHDSFQNLIQDGYYEDALSVAKLQLKRVRQMRGERDPLSFKWMNNLAEVQFLNAHYNDALQLIDLVILQSQASENGNPDTILEHLRSLMLKAEIFHSSGALDQCSSSLSGAFELVSRHRLDQSELAARLHYVKGQLLVDAGSDELAVESYRIALDLFLQQSSPLWQSRVFQKLGEAKIREGQLVEGRQLLDQSIMLRSKMQLKRHPDWADALDNMAALLILSGNLGAPLSLVDKAQTIRNEIFRNGHPERLKSNRMRALLMEAIGDLRSALREQTVVYDKMTKFLGLEHPRLFSVSVALARLHTRLNDLGKANEFFRKAQLIVTKFYASSKLKQMKLQLTEALIYSASAKYFQANAIYQQILLDKSFSGRSEVLHRAAELQLLQGNSDAAELMLAERLRLLEKDLGNPHPMVGEALKKLAALHYERGKPELAVKLISTNLKRLVETVGEDHPEVLGRLSDNIFYQQIAKQLVQAAESFEMALRIQKRNFGETHSEVLVTMSNLAGVYGLLGRKEDADKLLREIRLIEAGGNPRDKDILFGNSPGFEN